MYVAVSDFSNRSSRKSESVLYIPPEDNILTIKTEARNSLDVVLPEEAKELSHLHVVV